MRLDTWRHDNRSSPFFCHQFLFFNLVLFYILVKVIFSVLNIIVFNVINNYKNIEFFIESQKEIWINL